MTAQSALVELREALADLIAEDEALNALLSGRKVFALQPPPSAALNYVVIGPVLLDVPAGHFSQPGRRHRRRLTAWARSPDTAEEIYARLCALLDGAILSTLEGHRMESASLSFLAGPREDTAGTHPITGKDTKAWGIDMEWAVATLEGV